MNFLYIGERYDQQYTAFLKNLIDPSHNITVKRSETTMLTEISQAYAQVFKLTGEHFHGIICSNKSILRKYLRKVHGAELAKDKKDSLYTYAGCMFKHQLLTPSGQEYNIPVIIIPPLKSLSFSLKDRFIYKRYISKLYDVKSFIDIPVMEWEIGTPETLPSLYKLFNSPNCKLMSLDIETAQLPCSPTFLDEKEIEGIKTAGIALLGIPSTKSGGKTQKLEPLIPAITCVGFTGIFKSRENGNNTLHSYTVVIPMRSMELYQWVKKFAETPAPKVMTNGQYDTEWLLRYDIAVNNYAFDTFGLMHSWYVELPRSLDFTTSFIIRNHMYWKDESGDNLYEYNAKDCHATAWACLGLLNSMPDWAIKNFVLTFKMVFPFITCNLEGFKQNVPNNRKLWKIYQTQIAERRDWFSRAICENFNPGSPPQVKTLFNKVLACGLKATGKNELKAIQHKNPTLRFLSTAILQARESNKADSTYMNIVPFAGRILYSLNPFGTTTSRASCKESNFWCGSQVQNQPLYVKSIYEFDDGWEGTAIDNAQSESRTTAYITQDEALIDAVENSKDFHVRNASLFFGIPEEELFEMAISDPARFKTIRNKIGKRVNHGANYNMMENVLIQTMGPDAIIEAKHTLKLPGKWSFFEVASYLLSCFDAAYTKIRSREEGGYHYDLIDQVESTSKLVTPDGWTRYTFKTDLRTNKMSLNALVAHLPQGWSVRIINKAAYAAWKKYQIDENLMRLKAQVHDEIIFQTKPENTKYVTDGVSELMALPSLTGYKNPDGTPQQMVIPNDPKSGARLWSDLKE